MKTIKLNIPKHNANPMQTVSPSIAQVQGILKTIPLANPQESCQQLIQLLHKLNRAPLNTQPRIKIMALIHPCLTDIINALRTNYINSSLPLTKRGQQTAQDAQQLLTEISYSYKIIVHELLEEQQVTGTGSAELPQALYSALTFNARLLVDHYALYATEPKHIWQELNQLYHYAEKQKFHNVPMDIINSSQEAQPTTIANAYQRIVLLALANPFHLMQGEATKLYDKLAKWAQHCKITPLAKNNLPEGKLFIDLNMDTPPLYAPTTASNLRPSEGRLLDITSLLDVIEKEIHQLGFEGGRATLKSNLAQRLERDMFFRWSAALGARRERMSHRKPIDSPTLLIFGLTTTHHFVNNKQPFTPEEGEIETHRKNSDKKPDGNLLLIPEELNPWQFDEQTKKPKIGVEQPKTSQLDPEIKSGHNDLWSKVYTNAARSYEGLINDDQTEYEPHHCQIININQGGFGLFCDTDSKIPARIGELFGAQTNSDTDNWIICAVRWMKISAENNISLGTRIISKDARAVAIKAVSGIGMGGEYYRGLIVPDLDPRENPTTLITPAAVYDVSSIVSITMDNQTIYAKLIRQLESSSEFTHYQFELVDKPNKEDIFTASQELRKLNNLHR